MRYNGIVNKIQVLADDGEWYDYDYFNPYFNGDIYKYGVYSPNTFDPTPIVINSQSVVSFVENADHLQMNCQCGSDGKGLTQSRYHIMFKNEYDLTVYTKLTCNNVRSSWINKTGDFNIKMGLRVYDLSNNIIKEVYSTATGNQSNPFVIDVTELGGNHKIGLFIDVNNYYITTYMKIYELFLS